MCVLFIAHLWISNTPRYFCFAFAVSVSLSLSLLVFYVTCNDISVIYVTERLVERFIACKPVKPHHLDSCSYSHWSSEVGSQSLYNRNFGGLVATLIFLICISIWAFMIGLSQRFLSFSLNVWKLHVCREVFWITDF